MGLATGPLLGVAVSVVASARSGTAAALINVARMVGATLGVAVLGSIYAGIAGGSRGLCLAMLAGGSMQIATITLRRTSSASSSTRLGDNRVAVNARMIATTRSAPPRMPVAAGND
jgi:hypothetical protein